MYHNMSNCCGKQYNGIECDHELNITLRRAFRWIGQYYCQG
jgi:hypothetical protein